MEQITRYLLGLQGDVYKLLPMREAEENGREPFVDEYLEALIVNVNGALGTYPVLAEQKKYLWIINNLQFLSRIYVAFPKWRTVVLNTVSAIGDLAKMFGGNPDGK